jgi:hypothetical protein
MIVFIILSGVRLSPLGTEVTTGLLYQLQMIDDGDCGAIGEMKIDKGNRRTRRKPIAVSLCTPQIPHDPTRARTRAATVGSQRLTAWAMARPQVNTFSQTVVARNGNWCKMEWKIIYESSVARMTLVAILHSCGDPKCYRLMKTSYNSQ